MEAFNWALIGLSGGANLETALAGLELARDEIENEAKAESQEPKTIPLNQDDGTPVLKIFYESLPGSPWSGL
jgi:hypothetical protein